MLGFVLGKDYSTLHMTHHICEFDPDKNTNPHLFTITATLRGEDHVCQYDYSYDSENKVNARCIIYDSEVKLDEQYSYDSSNRLTKYFVAAGYDPDFLSRTRKPSEGIIEQEFTFNARNSITPVRTNLDGGKSDTARYSYTEGSSKVSRIEHSLNSHFPPKVTFSYDLDGNIAKVSSAEGGITMTYSVSGRLLTYNDPANEIAESFSYDAFDRVQSDGMTNKYYYGNDIMVEKDSTDTETEFVRCGKRIIAEKKGDETVYIGMDQFLSAVLSHGPTEINRQSYDPYGSCVSRSRTGYKGELRCQRAPIS